MMEQEVNEMAVVKFDITEAEISELRSKYMELTIKGMDDKPGFDAVHRARIDIKGRRVFVEKTGKQYREKAVAFQKAVIAEEKRIIGLLAPIEDYLADQESRVMEELAQIKAEAEAKIQAIFQARENRLLDMGCRFDRIAMTYSYGELIAPVAMVKVAPDDMFEKICVAIQGAVDAEKAAKAAEETRRLEEQALILKVQQEQEEERQRQAKERERLAAEAKSLQDMKDFLSKQKKAAEDAILKAEQDKQRAIEMEKAKAEAAEKAAKETAERFQRETEAKWAREKAEAEEKEAKIRADLEEKTMREEAARIKAEKKAARLPDKVKLQNYLVTMFGIPAPEMKTPEGIEAWNRIDAALEELNIKLGQIVEAL